MAGWQDFGCSGSARRWRQLENGMIEIEGQGTPLAARAWPTKVNERAESIGRWAAHYEVPEPYVAAIMALETAGENVCRTAAGGLCHGGDCECVSGEGCGVMATLPATYQLALELDHRPTCSEIMSDEDQAVRAGTAYLKMLLDKYDGDFVKAAVAYNAGSVRCGRGKTWGSQYPKQECPDPSDWGVVVGCVYGDQQGALCAPTTVDGTPPYVCTNDYPGTAIRWLNSALQNYNALPSTQEPGSSGIGLKIVSFAAGAWLGKQAWDWLKRRRRWES